MELNGETGGRDSGSGRVEGYPPERVALVAVVAACLAAGEMESPPAAGPKGMPVWKRAALAELMNAGVDIKDFI